MFTYLITDIQHTWSKNGNCKKKLTNPQLYTDILIKKTHNTTEKWTKDVNSSFTEGETYGRQMFLKM